MSEPQNDSSGKADSASPADQVPVPIYSADELTAGGPVAQIRMDGLVYTLRITRQRKLILTK